MRIGQKIKDESISTLTHSAGIISLAPSVVNIGGVQVDTDALSRTISSDVTLVANTRYMIYVVLLTGAPVIRISTNVNSVGPVGFTSWKLVGAFYSNGITGSIAFGSFVNIEGAPETTNIPYTPITTALGAVSAINMTWKREGSHSLIVGRFTNGTVDGTQANVGLPTNLASALTDYFVVGNYGHQGSATGKEVVYHPINLAFAFGMSNWQIFATGTQMATAGFTSLNATVPITGWDVTQLKDL